MSRCTVPAQDPPSDPNGRQGQLTYYVPLPSLSGDHPQAAGLTNRQIGKRLFLSHRTVAAHLHRAFPKLGVTTRAALRDALAALPQSNTATIIPCMTLNRTPRPFSGKPPS
jgi:hypothetical protein